jgi:hypothetical protein
MYYRPIDIAPADALPLSFLLLLLTARTCFQCSYPDFYVSWRRKPDHVLLVGIKETEQHQCNEYISYPTSGADEIACSVNAVSGGVSVVVSKGVIRPPIAQSCDPIPF